VKSFNLSRWAIDHPAFTAFLMIAIFISGIQAYFSLGRAEDPTFTIKTAIVAASWPGATTTEMQNQVADRVETKLRQLPQLDFLRTYCLPGQMLTLVQLRDDTRGRDVPEIWYQLRKKLDDLRPSLPPTLSNLSVNDEYGDVYSAIYAVVGDDFSPAEMKRLCETARLRLLRLPGVEKVDLLGTQPEQIHIEFSPEKLSGMDVTPSDLMAVLRTQNELRSSGSIETVSDRLFVRVDASLSTEQRIRGVPVTVGGRTFTIGDLAEVKRGYADPPATTMRYNGKPAVGLGVVMSANQNVITLGEELDTAMQAFESETPLGISIGKISFQPEIVNESVTEFLRSFVEALLIVLFVSFISLGLRTGIVVAISVPIVLAITFTVMSLMGMDLDRISLGALILALGLLVDDAIIAIEMMSVKLEEGFDRASAATFTWQSTAMPMLSGTLITVAGFLPVGLAKSAAGEYAGGIFWVVGVALIASWFVAVIFIPYLGMLLLPDGHRRDEKELSDAAKGHDHDSFQRPFHRAMRYVVTACVSYPYVVVMTTVLMFVSAIIGFAFVPQQFFPLSSRLELLVDIRLPEASAIGKTESIVASAEALLQRLNGDVDPETGEPPIDHFTSYVGIGSARFFLALNPDLPNPAFGKIVVVTKDVAAREKVWKQLNAAFADDPEFADARMRVKRLEFGPPVGYPVQYRVVGPDADVVASAAAQVRDLMRRDAALVDTHIDGGERGKVIDLELNHGRLSTLGIDPQSIAETMQTMLSGTTVTQVRENTELVDVVVRAKASKRLDPASINDLTVRSRSGQPITVSQLASVKYTTEDAILWRRDQESMLTVRADVVDGVQAPEVSARLTPEIKKLSATLPMGHRIDVGGAIEESEKANVALFSVFPLMVLVMLTLLMLQVQNFRKLFLVFGIAPLGLIGATIFLLLFNAPFGFVALLGLIALAGMDMRNSVILIDQIEQDHEAGMSLWNAVIESAVRRARPVVLTAATAILAMIPLSRSVFWGPMAIAIMGGLSVATFLTLLNLPSLYVILFRVKKPT